MILCRIKTFLAATLLTYGFIFSSTIHAQDYQTPVVTDLNLLPSLQNLKSTPGWSEFDSEIATSLVRKLLREHPENGPPIDCKFELSEPIYKNYALNEHLTKAETLIRRSESNAVGFEQVGVQLHFPDEAVGFLPTQPEAWQLVESQLLPHLVSAIEQAYSHQYAMQTLIIKGFGDACDDLKNYLSLRFRITPSTVSCISSNEYSVKFSSSISNNTNNNVTSSSYSLTVTANSNFASSYYKLTYPYAQGYRYRKVTLKDCVYESHGKLQEKELKLNASSSRDTPKVSPLVAAAPITTNTSLNSKEAKDLSPREIKAKEKAEFKEFLAKQKQQEKEEAEKEKQRQIQAQKTMADRALKFLSPTLPEGALEAQASTEDGKALVSAYRKTHNEIWANQSEVDSDEKKLEQLKDKVKKGEEEWLKKASKDGKDYIYDLDSVILEPGHSFDLITIPTEILLTSDEIKTLTKMLQGQKHEWLLGCRPRTLVRKNEKDEEVPQSTVVDCLTPRFIVNYTDKNAVGKSVTISLPTIGKIFQTVKNQCGVVVGSKNKLGIESKEVTLFKKAQQKENSVPSYVGNRMKTFPSEILISAGITGKVFDLFTKKPIANADMRVNGIATSSEKSDATGSYLFKELRMKGMERRLFGHHHQYYDNYVTFLKLKPGEVVTLDDLYLDPKRVDFSGTVSETFKPKFGSGLKGIKVSMKDYPQFSAETDENGNYTLKQVPASLTEVMVVDPTTGHQPKNFSVTLNPDVVNDHKDVVLVPNLTTIRGKLYIHNGKPVDGVTVSLEGFPEYTQVTDQNGIYEFKDIPTRLSAIQVTGDSENIYDSKTEAIGESLRPYTANHHDILIKYNRSDISGRVYDVLSKAPISGAKIWIEGAKERYFATSDSYGYYEIRKVPDNARKLNIEIDNKSYIARPRLISPLPVPGTDVKNQDFKLVLRSYTTNRIVFVLTWNERQHDLDSQLFLPNGEHLYFKTLGNRSQFEQAGAYLDHDDTSNAGRETTIITLNNGSTMAPGTYRFLVFQYGYNNINFQEAGALVEIYKDGEFWKEVTPGPGRGRLWYVGNIVDNSVSIIDQFPAAELYQKIDTIQKNKIKLKEELNQIELEVNSISGQVDTAMSKKKTNDDLLATKEKRIQELKEIIANPPPKTSIATNTGNSNTEVTPPETPKAELKRISQEKKALEETISKDSNQIQKLQSLLEQKKTLLAQKTEINTKRDAEYDTEINSITQELNRILATYH